MSKRNFKMHPKLLMDVIARQAGTLVKAVTEGLMNSIDAKATKVDVTFNEKTITIQDDGEGFKDHEQIERCFETFGQPHEESEKKIYGNFRMGRGQMFAFGHNIWRTGPFEMDVDFKGKGLGYELRSDLPDSPGCKVVITLYEDKRLNRIAMRELTDEIIRAVAYVDVPITLNGELANSDPNKEKWTETTDEAWFRFKKTGDMKIYNLGIFVASVPSTKYGCGGEIVSRKQLKLNFARNEVMADCPTWKKMKPVIDKHADREIKENKRSLSEAERKRLIQNILDETVEPEEAFSAPVIKDSSNRFWSLHKLTKSTTAYRLKKVISAAPPGDNRADKMMQHNLAIVLDRDYLKAHFRTEKVEEFIRKFVKPVLDRYNADAEEWKRAEWKYVYKPYAKLVEDLDDEHTILPEKEWTEVEKSIAIAISSGLSHLNECFDVRPERRTILIGQSTTANAWTDGESYIAFGRDFLKKIELTFTGWIRIGWTAAHEMCHDHPTSATHNHSPEFHEMFHNVTREGLSKFVDRAVSSFTNSMEASKKRLTRRQLRDLDRDTHMQKLVAADSK